MNGIPRAVLFAVLATSSLPAVAEAQNVSVDSLVSRIVVLERTTTDLERRVRELEALTTGEPLRERSVLTSRKWRELQNWRRLRRGMTMDEVRTLLGEPEKVDAYGAAVTIWRWESVDATVRFNGSSGTLDSWSEPRT